MDHIVDFLNIFVHEELSVAEAANRTSFASLRLWEHSRFLQTLLIGGVTAERAEDHLFLLGEFVMAGRAPRVLVLLSAWPREEKDFLHVIVSVLIVTELELLCLCCQLPVRLILKLLRIEASV